MSETLRFGMPLLDAAQAQKHITVNEALLRVDALGAGRVESADLTVPPVGATDGEAYIVATGATGAWLGQDGNVALFLNGGWEFAAPFSGLTIWIESEGTIATFGAGSWIRGYAGGSAGGAATLSRVLETDHLLASATVSTTAAIIPDKAIVLGVTGRVIQAISGASSWSLGVAGSPDRYGSGYGVALNSFAQGLTSQPQSYFGATPLEITSADVAFTGGRILLSVHILELSGPSAI